MSGEISKHFLLDAKDYLPPTMSHFKFDNDNDFLQHKQGFIVKNTADDAQTWLRLFNG